jgi:hypothetical protein
MTIQELSNTKTGDIRVGDIVLEHGMRVRIDEIRTYPGRNTCPEDKTVYACVGTVLNRDEVLTNGVVPASFLRRWDGSTMVRDDEWIVQGNDFARWNLLRDV